MHTHTHTRTHSLTHDTTKTLQHATTRTHRHTSHVHRAAHGTQVFTYRYKHSRACAHARLLTPRVILFWGSVMGNTREPRRSSSPTRSLANAETPSHRVIASSRRPPGRSGRGRRCVGASVTTERHSPPSCLPSRVGQRSCDGRRRGWSLSGSTACWTLRERRPIGHASTKRWRRRLAQPRLRCTAVARSVGTARAVET